MAEEKCEVHGLSRETSCSWCGKTICKQCIESSDLRKYCTKCYYKLSKNTVAKYLDDRHQHQETKQNIDPSLSDEDLEKKKQMLEMKDTAKKIMAGK